LRGSPRRRAEADLLLRRLLFAAYFFEVGLLLVIVPWSSFWDRNVLLEALPLLYEWTRSPYVRGAVSGFGVVNMAAGLVEVAKAWQGRHEEPGPTRLFSRVDGARQR
jgi:hypothetical protein